MHASLGSVVSRGICIAQPLHAERPVKATGLTAVSLGVTGVDVTLESGERLRAPVVIGADGVRSRIAKALGLGEANYAGYIAYRYSFHPIS